MRIILKDLPKISLNKWYSSSHWSDRKKIKDQYKIIVKNQFKEVFSKDKSYQVDYSFAFKTKPLDASNCVAMVKLIEDIIFEDDKWNVIEEISISSFKGIKDILVITVNEL